MNIYCSQQWCGFGLILAKSGLSEVRKTASQYYFCVLLYAIAVDAVGSTVYKYALHREVLLFLKGNIHYHMETKMIS